MDAAQRDQLHHIIDMSHLEVGFYYKEIPIKDGQGWHIRIVYDEECGCIVSDMAIAASCESKDLMKARNNNSKAIGSIIPLYEELNEAYGLSGSQLLLLQEINDNALSWMPSDMSVDERRALLHAEVNKFYAESNPE